MPDEPHDYDREAEKLLEGAKSGDMDALRRLFVIVQPRLRELAENGWHAAAQVASVKPKAPLSDALTAARPAELAGLLASVDTRPDLRALEAGLAEANAAVRLGAASRRPDLSLGGWLQREGGEQAANDGLTVAPPTVGKGRALRADGSRRGGECVEERAPDR